MNKKRYLVILLFCLFPLPAWAADWYVSNSGAGSKNGTSEANAWEQTPTWGSMSAGDTLYVVDVIHGITTWSIDTTGTTDNYFTVEGSDSDAGIVLGVEKDYTDWSGPDAYGAYSVSYTATVQGAIEWLTASGPLTGTKLTNRGKVPDGDWVAGDYYYDTGGETVYWKPYGGAITNKTVTFDASLSIAITSVDWVKVSGLSHLLTRYRIGRYAASDYIWLDNITIENVASIGIGVNASGNITGSDNGKITNCAISDVYSGIYLMSSGDAYNNDRWLIKDNTITNVHTSDDAHGIGIQNGEDNVIEGNDISYCNTGITMWSGTSAVMNNNIIRYNHIHHSEVTRGDGRAQGIGWEGNNQTPASMTGNQVYYNLVHDCGQAGIRSKFIDPSNYIYNNTVIDCAPNFQVNGVTADLPVGSVIKNNLSVSTSGNHWYISVYNDGDYSDLTINNNLYYDDTGTKFYIEGTNYNFADWKTQLAAEGINGADAMSANSNPLLVDVYKLQSNSPAIDTGTDVGLTQDYDGTTVPQGAFPDIGAYEYTAATISGCTISGGTIQ